MRTIAQCKLALDMMCERALSRESHGSIIAENWRSYFERR